MSDLIVYRSDSPEVIEAFTNAAESRKAWSGRVDDWAQQAIPGVRRGAVLSTGLGNASLAGVEMLTTNEAPPEGWRVHRNRESGYEFFVPKVSTKAGKCIKAEIHALNPAPDVRAAVPGMPRYGGVFASPGYELREGDTALYCLWSVKPSERQVDASLWEQVPLSRYYAVKEAEDAADAEPVA